MPKELREIKHFNSGTILNASEQDIPEDAAAFSLNINPIAEGGILEAINNDKIVANIEGNLTYFNTPVSWGNAFNSVNNGYNGTDIKVSDVSIFQNRNNVRLDFVGTKGVKESLTAYDIEPTLEKIFAHGNLVTVFGFADESEAISNSSVALTIDNGAGGSPYATSAILKDAFIGRRVYDSDGNFHGECTNAVRTSGSNSTLTFDGGLAYAVTDNKKLYTKLFLDYTPTAALTATADYISYNTDTLMTSTLAYNSTSFQYTGFTNNIATITIIEDTDIATTIDTNLHGETFTLTTPDGRIKTYEFSSDVISQYTGGVHGSGNIDICIDDSGDDPITTTDDIVIQIQSAITYSTGHGGRIDVTREGNVLTLTYIGLPFTQYFETGDYISFHPYLTQFNGAEIVQITNIDTINKRIYLKRNCFDTGTTTLAAGTTYLIFSNRKTINEVQSKTNEGYISLKGWSDYSGNDINGNSNYLARRTTTAEKAGLGVFVSSAYSITYSITNKTIVISHASQSIISIWEFNEGDTITLYQSGVSTNNGYKGKILKQVYTNSKRTLTMTMDTAPNLAETESSDTIYIEANLLKNHTFHHAVGLTNAYKVNDWVYKNLEHDNGASLSANKIAYNYYVNYAGTSSVKSQNMVAQVTSGGYWEDTKAGHTARNDSSIYGPGHGDLAESYFPFVANDAYVSITSDYHEIATTASSQWGIAVGISDTILITNTDISEKLASGDIIKSSTEYMQVVKVEKSKLTVIRGLYGTDAIAHTALNGSFLIEKSINPCISQDIPKSSLKGGQTYKLSFYAKGATSAAIGAMSLRLNGGYIGSDGIFIEPKNDRSLGLANDFICQEDRWIDIFSLYKANNDNNSTLDDVWRLYTLVFDLPHKILTDLEVEFTSRGPDGTIVHLDLLDLSEHTYAYPVFAGESEIISTGFIDNKGVVDLVVFGPKGLGILPAFDGTLSNSKFSKPTLSNHAASEISSFHNNASIVSRNREVHVGLGGEKSDSAPQWLGYINHTLFGKDYSEELYQDEDTVHSYDDSGINNISKICLAGEHEYLVAYWNNSGGTISDNSIGTEDLVDNRLRIHHASHYMNTGDAIVAREWADTDNSWDGSGVWIVTDGDEDDYFDCRRYNTKDPDPAEEGIMATSSTSYSAPNVTVNCDAVHNLKTGDNVLIYGGTNDTDVNTTHSISVTDTDTYTFSDTDSASIGNDTGVVTVKQFRLCYRPYFHYGIKRGENYLYRIWPELRINESLATDSTFGAGKIEQSYPLDEFLVSISTCYNKEDDGTGGGRIYGLTDSGKVLVLDVQVKYDNWQKNPLTTWSTITTKYKSYKWSNDNINGKIGGSLDVFGDTDTTTPTITPTGNPSDILETKGTTSTFELDATSRNTNQPNDFDTRLWIQYKPPSGETFGEGARFLFCGKSETTNTNSNSDIYMADRSPSMTMLLPFPINYEIHINGVSNEHVNFWGGPGPCSKNGMYNTPDHGDLDDEKQRQYAYYQHYPYNGSNHDMEYWAPRNESIFNSTSWSAVLYQSSGGTGLTNSYSPAPYVNFGYNMGWQGKGAIGPSVKVARFGLFPVADNDRDGLLDGTGVVTANKTSLPDTLSTYRKMGPYGELHRRVSSHAVGIIGGSDNDWCRNWGKVGSFRSDRRYFGFQEPGNGPLWYSYGEDAPSDMIASKFTFICADMHYGDLPLDVRYEIASTAGLATSADARVGENNSHSIDTLTGTTIGDVIQGGDLIYHQIASSNANYIQSGPGAHDNRYFNGEGNDWVSYAASGTFTIDEQQSPNWTPEWLEGAGDSDTAEQGFSLADTFTDDFVSGRVYIIRARMKNNNAASRTACGASIAGGSKALFQSESGGLSAGVVDNDATGSGQGDPRWYNATVTAGSSGPVLITYAQNYIQNWNIYSIEIKEQEQEVVNRVGPVIQINSSTQITSYNPFDFSDTGFILPHSVEAFNQYSWGNAVRIEASNDAGYEEGPLRGSLGHNTQYQHFHWAYDKDNPSNGDIFTEGEGCGHYTRTFYSAPSAWGYTPTLSSGSFHNTIHTPARLPGIINRVDKLNFRSGFMIRPFETSENTFEDFIVGNGTYVDIPSAPDAVYHVNNDAGSNDYLHYHVNDDAINNQFASKMIIASPKADDGSTRDEQEDLTTKVYICDMNFMYPDPGSVIPQSAWDGENTEVYPTSQVYNGAGNDSGEICYAGTVTGYTSTSTTDDGKENATINPVVITAGTTGALHNIDVLGASSIYRDQCFTATTNDRYSMLAGLCISVIDQTYGTVQTRYIVATTSHGTSGTSDFYFHVHYPFGHAPANGDKFYLWRHESACTAPIRLFKEKELRNGIGSALTADPTLSQAIYKDTGAITTIDGDGTTVTVTTTVNHNLTSNDKVTITDTTNYDGPYSITVTAPDIFTFSQADTTDHASETGTWTLLDSYNSKESASNPLTLGLNKITGKTMFGGLDMRKLRSYVTTGDDIQGSAVASELVVHSTGHLLNTGDMITIQGNTAAHDGTYIIKDGDTADNFDVTNSSTANDTTDAQPITTNQWETLVIESGNKASIGELRHGLNSWDRGDIQGNIIRNDSTVETALYMNVSSSSVSIEAGSVGDEDGDLFLKTLKYQYKISLMYDGYQEGPLSASLWQFQDTVKTRSKLLIKISLKEYSRRLTHVCLYRRNGATDFFKLVKQIPTTGGWADKEGVLVKEIADTGTLGGTYSSRTGLFETLDTIKLKYGISAEIDGYLFAGKCSHENIKNASNLIFRSKPGMFSIFDYSSDFLTLKSNPNAMVNYLGRLYIFDANNVYKINPHTLVIEDTFEGIGCLSKDSIIVTEQGMFFADRNGAYFHNGQVPTKISIPIQKGGDTSVSFGGTDNIKDLSWNGTIGSNKDIIPKVTYDGNLNSIYFIFTVNDYFTSSVQEKQLIRKSYIWAYNLTLKRWDLWELCNDSFVGTPFIGKNGSTFIPIDSVIYEHTKGPTKRKFTWLSKKMNITYDSNLKVFKKIKVNGLSENLALNGSYKESSDRLLISTSKGIIANSDITYTAVDVNDSDYKLSGSNKRGKWLQFKLEDMSGTLDSVGIVFRTKPIK